MYVTVAAAATTPGTRYGVASSVLVGFQLGAISCSASWCTAAAPARAMPAVTPETPAPITSKMGGPLDRVQSSR